MKVLHVTHAYHPDPGGIETYLRMVIGAQRSAGDEVVVLTGSVEPREVCEVVPHEVEGTRVLTLHRDDWYNDHYAHSYNPGASRLVREVFASERPDVVHVHQWIRLTSDLVATAHAMDIPTIVTLHDVYTSCPRAFRIDRDERPCDRPLSIQSCAGCVPRFGFETGREVEIGIEMFRDQYRSELELADRVLVAAGVTADLLHRTTGIARDRFTIAPLPYQPRFEDVPRPAAAPPPVRFAYWGNLSPHKGPHVLIEAFRNALGRVDVPIELHLFGPLATVAMRDRLTSLTADLPATLHGEFDGAQLAAASLHVAVFPVICFEGFGLGLAEAFELGIPAIVSDIGALSDRIGAAGLKVPPDDAGALADAIVRMAHDADFRAECTSAIPGPPDAPREHVAAVRKHYTDAIAGERRDAPTLDIGRRTELLVIQRESHARALREARGRKDPC